MRSIILGAPPGTGKTTIKEAIQGDLSKRKLMHVLELSRKLDTLNPKAFDEYFKQVSEGMPSNTHKLLIIVDEALKNPDGQVLRRNGVNMLEAAHARGIRFLFIDAGFTPTFSGPGPGPSSEFMTRCRDYYLSGLDKRPMDIPYIIAARLLERAKAGGLRRVRVEGAVLLAITDATLAKPNPRRLCNLADVAYRHAVDEGRNHDPLRIAFRHLSEQYRSALGDRVGGDDYYDFVA